MDGPAGGGSGTAPARNTFSALINQQTLFFMVNVFVFLFFIADCDSAEAVGKQEVKVQTGFTPV